MLPDLIYRLRAIFRRDRMEGDLDEEIRLHVEREAEAYTVRGVPPDEARRRAKLALGGQEQVKEACRDARGVTLVETLLQDVRYAARVLLTARGYSTAAILTLALGIGATAAIFTVVNGLVLRPLPVRDPERLVAVREDDPQRPRPWLFALAAESIRERPELFERACGWVDTQFNLASRGEAEYVQGLWTSGEFFETLGIPALLGRTLTPADDKPGGGPDGPVALISYGFWQRRFGGAATVIGRSLTIERLAYTIVGVTPAGFVGPTVGRSFDVALPSGVVSSPVRATTVVGRLRPGQTAGSVTLALRALQPRIREATLPAWTQAGLPANFYLRQPLSATTDWSASPLRSRFERPLMAMLLLAGLVLLVACANVANLVLARASTRRHEMSVRRALGASRTRLARQVLVESLLLSAVGAASGLGFAHVFSRLLLRQVSTETNPTVLDLSLDWRVLAFTASVAVGTALLFGSVPAFRASRVHPFGSLKQGGRGTAGDRRWRLNQLLIAGQVGLSVVLVVAAGLFVRTFATMATMDLGFDRERTSIVSLNTEDAHLPATARTAMYERVRQAVASVPGVADAVVLRITPVSGDHWAATVEVPGYAAPPALVPGQGPFLNAVSRGYFAMFGAQILAGRSFEDRDRQGAPLVAVVNESFARLFVQGRNPVGETLRFATGTPSQMAGEQRLFSPPFQIVGLAKDAGSATHFGLREGVPPMVYLSVAQMSSGIEHFTPPASFRIGVRVARGSAATLGRDIAAAIGRVAPQLRITQRTLASSVDATLTAERLTALLSGLFGSLALVLAGVGIFGVTAYVVSQRRPEIAIRVALGAPATEVVRTVLQRLLTLVAVGLALGGMASLWASRFVAALLFGLQPRDPVTFAGTVFVLAVVAFVAGWLPARRAARIDPATVLRQE